MTIQQIYNSYYKYIPLDVFNAAVAADPTSYNQGEVVKVGNFVKWILKLYQNNAWKHGDSYETKDLLSKFIKYKSKLPVEKRDINRYNSISDLYSIIQTIEEQGVKTQNDIKKEGAEVVYEDSEWKIVIPHTEEASCIYGANTRWCTAGRERNMFKYYNDKGPLYININKVTGDKYQFYFESNSFMDAEDEYITLRNIGLSEGAENYYKSIGKEFYFIYDKVWRFYNEIARVKLDEKGYNFINEQGKLLWEEDKWFDNAWDFFQGFAKVEIEGRGRNYINTNGELLWKEYKNFDDAWDFWNGFASVYKEGRGWNYIDTQGELLWKGDKWFDSVGDFHYGYARVNLEGRGWNFINSQVELLWKEDKWFDDAWSFSNGFAWVKKAGKYNIINLQGELLWREFKNFDRVGNFSEGFAPVYKKGKGWNIINTQGEYLWKEDKCVDDVGSFIEGFASVYIKGKGYNFINKQGELVYKGDKWFDWFKHFDNGFAWIYKEGKWYRLNSKGEIVN